MNFDWLKAISARIGIEGRNTIIFLSVAFCGFGVWLFERSFGDHPILSSIFLASFLILAVATILIGLLAQAKPSEVAEKYLLQQVDKQILFAGGFQSPSEIVDFLRAAHNVHDLPPPFGLVKGSARNEAEHQTISSADAECIARDDKAGVDRMLLSEAQRILARVQIRQVVGSATKQIEGIEPNELAQKKQDKKNG